MEIVNGSIVIEADGVRHVVAEFSFDGFESGIGFAGFAVQFLHETLRGLISHKVPVRCEIEPVTELDEYDAQIVVVFPDPEWVDLLWPVMVFLSKGMSGLADSEDLGLVVWGTYEEMGVLA